MKNVTVREYKTFGPSTKYFKTPLVKCKACELLKPSEEMSLLAGYKICKECINDMNKYMFTLESFYVKN